MSRIAPILFVAITAITFTMAGVTQSSTPKTNAESFVIVFKDGHQKNFSTSDVSRIDFKNPGVIILMRGGHEERLSLSDVAHIDFSPPASALQPGRNHFVGKWKAGQGNGDDFYITLNRDGQATKSIGATHGTWVVVDGEARIAWDDGWHDAIRPVGTKHEKVAYEPGKSFDDEPSNITDARRVDAQPI